MGLAEVQKICDWLDMDYYLQLSQNLHKGDTLLTSERLLNVCLHSSHILLCLATGKDNK